MEKFHRGESVCLVFPSRKDEVLSVVQGQRRQDKSGREPSQIPSQKPFATNDHAFRGEIFFLPTFIVQSKTTCTLSGGPNSSPGFATYWPCDWQFVSLLWASVSAFVYLAEISFVMETTAFRKQGLHLTASLIL